MHSRIIRLIWIVLAFGTLIFSVQTLSGATAIGGQGLANAKPFLWVVPITAFVVIVTLLSLFSLWPIGFFQNQLRRLRRNAIVFWLLVLVYFVYLLGHWLWLEQPTYGRVLTSVELCFLFSSAWGLLFLLFFDLDAQHAREVGSIIAQSRLSGVMVMLTTGVLIFMGAEFYLRLFYITTDAYGFTAMNYHWYQNFYYGHENSFGYRDFEPKPDSPDNALRSVFIVGDSFAAGHGIDDISETFPQILESELGENWDVNLIAQSGWDSDVETAWLNSYYENLRRNPRFVVLSYYLNDIDYLLNDDSTNPDAVFTFPENPTLYWFVLNYFVPNYIYYNLLQFTSPVRNTNFTDRLIRAHLDDEIWLQHEANLSQFANWVENHNSKLVILLWPQLAAIPQSKPALDRVRAFFEQRNALIVDMSDWMDEKNTSELILNRFDSHPSRLSNRLAANALYEVITSSLASESN